MTNLKNLVDVTAFYDYQYDTFNMKPHSHKGLEIMFLAQGNCQVEALGEKFRMKKGQFSFVNNQVPHKLFVKDKGHILNLEFKINDFEFFHSLFEGDALKEKFFTANDSSDVLNCLKRILSELSKSKCDKDLVAVRILELLQLVSMSYLNEKMENPLISQAISYIEKNFSHDLQVEEIAKHVGLNVQYLQRQFKRATGKTIVEWVTALRVERAKQLFASTNIGVTDIAMEVGYNSRQGFFKAFKKTTGISPKEFAEIQEREKTQRYVQTPYKKVK